MTDLTCKSVAQTEQMVEWTSGLFLPRLLRACVLHGPGSIKLVCCSVKASHEAELARLKQGCTTGGVLTSPVSVGKRVSTMCLKLATIKYASLVYGKRNGNCCIDTITVCNAM